VEGLAWLALDPHVVAADHALAHLVLGRRRIEWRGVDVDHEEADELGDVE
jgi:hypothetical protein